MRRIHLVQAPVVLRYVLLLILFGTLLIAASPGDAQTLLLTLNSPNPASQASFSHSIAMGDVNGDGRLEIASGAYEAGVGKVYIQSSLDGSLVQSLVATGPGTGLGGPGCTAIADINDDGKADIAAGTPGEDFAGKTGSGRAYVFSGADGLVLLTLDPPNPTIGADFGWLVAFGELNGDGKPDIVVTAPYEFVSGSDRGRAYAFSGSDGSLLFTINNPDPQGEPHFGYSLAVGNVDGIGGADVVIGAPYEAVGSSSYQGRAYVFSGNDGSLLYRLDMPTPQAGAFFGSSASVGDVNGDGYKDIVVGAPAENVDGRAYEGRVYVFSGANGSVLRVIGIPIPNVEPEFGYSVATGDLNSDGKADVVASAPFYYAGATSDEGRVYAFSGADGSPLLGLSPPNPQWNLAFGISLASGDIDGDGDAEIVVGAPYENVSGKTDQGRAYVYSGPIAPTPVPVGGFAEAPDEGGSGGEPSLGVASVVVPAAGALALAMCGWLVRRRLRGRTR